MSLFGGGNPFGGTSSSGSAAAPGTATAPAGGLFGALGSNTSAAPSGTSLFGASTSKPLFGGNPTTSAPSGSSLFAQPAGSTAPATSLFGQPSTASTQPATTSLFGGGATTSKVSSSWGAPPATTAPAASTTLFGKPAEQPNATQAQATAALAGSVRQGDQDGGNVQTAYFNNLLEKNKKRTRNDSNGSFGDMPSLQLGLGDISKRIRELGGGGQQHGRSDKAAADSRAHYLLAASGVNPGTTLKDLNAFTATSGPTVKATVPQDFEPDTYKYVGQMQQRTTQKMITEGLERANRAFEAWVDEQVSIDWDAQRRKVYEHFGLAPRGGGAANAGVGGSFGRSSRREPASSTNGNNTSSFGRSAFTRSTAGKSVIGAPDRNAPLFGIPNEKKSSVSGQVTDRFLMEKQARFAQRVTSMNEARLDDLSYPILGEFLGVEIQSPAGVVSQVQDAYKALIEIVQEDNNPRGSKPRQFAQDYLDENASSANSTTMRRRIVDGSRRALEKQFFAQLEALLVKNPREARIGGVPTNVNRIRAYVRLRQSRNDLYPDDVQPQTISVGDDDECCWAILFFLLRCGLVKEAMQYVRDNQVAFRSIERNMITYIGSYFSSEDRRLPRAQSEKINQEYNSMKNLQQGNKRDPYKLACFKIIGRCDLNDRDLGKAGQGVEDWTWLQFALARESNRTEESAADVFGLEEVQSTFREIGLKHFSKPEDNARGHGTFFLLQMLAGLFENAVHYLYQYSYVSAVHVAIGLAYYGLIRVADFEVSENQLLTYTSREQPQLSFGRMIGYYTRDFRTADAIAATDYLTLICLNSDVAEPIGSQQANVCHMAIRELVLETREFVALLGDMRPQTGERIAGAIEKRLSLIKLQSTDAFLSEVTIKAAEVADDAGRVADAVVLYHLAEDYDGVVTTANRAVSDMLAADENFTPQGLPQLPASEVAKQKSQARKLQQATTDASAGQAEEDRWSVTSLTALDNPIDLLQHICTLYTNNQLYIARVRDSNRRTMGGLLSIANVRSAVLEGKWDAAVTVAASTQLLPLDARGSTSQVRHYTQNVADAPPPVSRLVGPLLLWVLIAVGQMRAACDRPDSFETGANAARKEMLGVVGKDLMVFVGMVRLRVPNAIWEEMGLYQEEMLQ